VKERTLCSRALHCQTLVKKETAQYATNLEERQLARSANQDNVRFASKENAQLVQRKETAWSAIRRVPATSSHRLHHRRSLLSARRAARA
jgi:hypothetical protein